MPDYGVRYPQPITPADNPPGLAGAEPERNGGNGGPGANSGSGAAGTKHSADKPPLHLIPRAAMVAEAEVLAFGARKYAEWNWSKGLKWADAARAAIGHLYAFLDREDLDPESGLQHVAHARAETGFLLEFIARGTGEDDRRPARKPLGTVVSVRGDTAAVQTGPAVGTREWAWAMLAKGERVQHSSWPTRTYVHFQQWRLLDERGAQVSNLAPGFHRSELMATGWSIIRQDDSGTAHPSQTIPERS